MTTSISIDSEIAALCPELTPEEMNLLEASLEADGCRDALIVWKGHGILLDGHNRHRYCSRYKLPFDVRELEFATRGDAINWVIANQLGRRNLTDQQKAYLRGKRYRAEKTAGHGAKTGTQNDTQKTRERLAREFDVSPATVQRDADFAEAVDVIAKNAGPEAKSAILSGKTGATKKDIIALAQATPNAQKTAIASGKAGIKEAAPKPKPRPISDTFCKALGELSERLDSIREQYGTISDMFRSKLWETADTYYAVEMIHELAKQFASLDKEAQAYAKAAKKTA